MTIVIETGVAADPVMNEIPDWFHDLMPPGTPTERVVHQYGYHLVGKLANYKSQKFARICLISNWRFLRYLAESHPGVFDEVLATYSEISTSAN